MKGLKLAKTGYLAMSIVFYISGMVCIILPEIPPLGACIISGIVLICYGIIKMIGYFSRDLYCLAFQYDFACGLLLMVLGVIVLACNRRITPHLFAGLGVLILLDSLLSIQMSKDSKQFGLETWYNRKRHFSKSVRLAEPQPDQQSGLFKGLGILPNKQNLRFLASPGTVVLSVCIYKRPACHIAHRHSLRPPSTKFSPRH